MADNPIDQYCGKEQYGYLYRDNLYSLPFGQGWQFPKPVNSHWYKTQNGYLGANVYKLQCPLDAHVIILMIIIGFYAFWTIRKRKILF